MVDFNKRVAARTLDNLIDPVALYDSLDRASDKGPLRPAQAAVLAEWFSERRQQRDVIVKLHTGQGKTLIGLLILQSQLNAKSGPALYLCPDNFLIEQTCSQARQFGIATCIADPEIPSEFVDSKAILVASVQKLFNGLTRFGLRRRSLPVGTLLMDDAHACSDTIREQCRIRIPASDAAYTSLRTLFAEELERQGVGTFADILNGKSDAFLPVPYWSWTEHEADVARILSAGQERQPIRFAWPLLRDALAHCQCVVSGNAIEIEPYIPPLEAFGSYWQAKTRVFMSATVTDDAFLVKGLQLSPDVIEKPLTYEKERWSGEKMVLIPFLFDESLERMEIVHMFGKADASRSHGVVGLVPSFRLTKDWGSYDALIADKDSIGKAVAALASGVYRQTVVLVNRYDGVDLPDAQCRVLVFDSAPYSESLVDLHMEACRADSDATRMRMVRTIEQGLGRSVRGEKDYSVVIVTGTDLTRIVRDPGSRRFLSAQMAAQLEIGVEIADLARQDIVAGVEPKAALASVIRQCLTRDPGWKAFYGEQMQRMHPRGPDLRVLRLYAAELAAEQKHQRGDCGGAASDIQRLLDEGEAQGGDRQWYMQEMARYRHRLQRTDSQKLQAAAFLGNHALLRPPDGISVTRLTIVSHGRMERIMAWIRNYGTYLQLDVALSDILGRLVFGGDSEKFERALNELSSALGFVGERPDKEWKEGPDNLWALNDSQYLLWECKNEVDASRSAINKREAEQMNRSSAWFKRHYPGMSVKRIMVIPTPHLESAAAFLDEVHVMRSQELREFVGAVRAFFRTLQSVEFRDLAAAHLQQLVDVHGLSTEALLSGYSRPVKLIPRPALS